MGSWGHPSSRPCPRLSFSILFSGDHGKGRRHPRRESGAQASALGGPAVSYPAAQLCVRPPHPGASLHQTGRPTFLSPERPTLPSHCLRGAPSTAPLGATLGKHRGQMGPFASSQGGSTFAAEGVCPLHLRITKRFDFLQRLPERAGAGHG